MPNPSHVHQLQDVQLDKGLSYAEVPMAIIDWQVKKMCSNEEPLVKVIWKNHGHKEATWEVEARMRTKYPQLFKS